MTELRQSQIKTWLRCPALYNARYNLGIDLDGVDPNLSFGTDFHTEVENYHLGKAFDSDLLKDYTALYESQGSQVEVRFAFTPEWEGEPLPLPFGGIVDRLTDDHMYDVKTSRVSWSQRRADEDIQATAYLFWYWQIYGKLIPFTFIVYRKDWTEKSRFEPIQTVTTTRTPDDFHAFWLLCSKIINDIRHETTYPCLCRDMSHNVWSNI